MSCVDAFVAVTEYMRAAIEKQHSANIVLLICKKPLIHSIMYVKLLSIHLKSGKKADVEKVSNWFLWNKITINVGNLKLFHLDLEFHKSLIFGRNP